jgi:hypothetical protein
MPAGEIFQRLVRHASGRNLSVACQACQREKSFSGLSGMPAGEIFQRLVRHASGRNLEIYWLFVRHASGRNLEALKIQRALAERRMTRKKNVLY